MKRGVSPGVLIGIVFAFAAVFFGILLVSATSKQQKPTTVATVPSQLPTTPAAATVSSQPPPTPAVAIATLTKATGPTQYSFDALNDVLLVPPPPMPIRITPDKPIILSGWAVDAPNNAVAGGVIITVDNTQSYQATYGSDRDDVATVLGISAFKKSGFTIAFPPKMLAVGTHTLTMQILASGGKTYYQPDQTVTIDITPATSGSSATTAPTSAGGTPVSSAAALPPTVTTGAFAKASGTTTYTIQSLNETNFDKPVTAPIPVPSSGMVTLVGWAVDTAATNLAGGVIVSVDETVNYQATYGIARPDVAAVLGNPVYTKSGFTITFPASTLARGTHTITIKILTSDGKSYYQPDQQVAITVT